MKKYKIQLASLAASDKEIKNLARRNYKYIRSTQQFSQEKPPLPRLLFLFFQRLKKVKTLYCLKINWPYNSQIHPRKERIIPLYKQHGKTLKKADTAISNISQHYFFPKFFVPFHNIRELTLIDRPYDLKIVPMLQKLQVLTINVMTKLENFLEFSKSVIRTHSFKTLRLKLVFSSSHLEKSFTSISHAISKVLPKVKALEVFLYVNTEYVPITELLKITEHKITNIGFLSSFSRNLIPDFLKQSQALDKLQNLSIQIKDSSEGLIQNLQSLQSCKHLQVLDIKLSLSPTSPVAFNIFEHIKFPSSLVGFKLDMPLILAPLIVKNKQALVVFEKENTIDDTLNIFEDEPCFKGFFETIESAKNLKHIELVFKIQELFMSPYTNFYTSIVRRLPNAETIKLRTYEAEDLEVDPESQIEERGENCFNLALFFDCCPNLKKLKILDINMPNYYFGYLNLSNKFPHLTKFVLNNQETLFFDKLSQQLDRLVKSLPFNTLEAIDFGFTETISMNSLLKRIGCFKKFKNLRYFSARYKISKTEPGGSKALGLAFRSISTLQYVYLAFENEERDFTDFKQYLKYDNSIKELFVCFAIPE